jgi:N12 class adenine-specific DNA methylase
MIHTSERAGWNRHDVWLNARGLAEIEDVLYEYARHKTHVDVEGCCHLFLDVERRVAVRHRSEWGVLNEKIIQLERNNVLHLKVDDTVKVSGVTEGEIKVQR